MALSLIEEYSRSLEALTGNDFQCEVSARLQSVIIDFQTVPAKPQGDAGLDAFSHGGERAYCCYGPEHSAFDTNHKREQAIIEKFKADLRRIFELTFKKRKLVCCSSPEMATILPSGCKIKHVELLVNWFESHRVLAPILTAAQEYRSASQCKYVDSKASVVVSGPMQLANRYAVDELTIARARQRIFIQRVQQKAQTVTIASTEKFDQKMGLLGEMLPAQADGIQLLSGQLQHGWRMALAFEQELHDTVPNLHRAFEENRSRILTRVLELMLAAQPRPWTELGNATQIAAEILGKDFERLYGMLIQDVSSGEIARLIGECPIGWEKN
jgi:hypothetical protein